jgi:hypothetical protein
MKKVYLSASYARKLEVRRYADALRSAGLEVSSGWHDDDSGDVDVSSLEASGIADKDLLEIEGADVFVAFTDGHPTRAGHQVEFGAALVLGLWVVRVGPVEHHFHQLANVSVEGGVSPADLADVVLDLTRRPG